jgi:phosphoglycerate dehydrogenase-like enzyme
MSHESPFQSLFESYISRLQRRLVMSNTHGDDVRIAILDNYNDLAQTSADWSVLAAHELTFFNAHEPDEAKLIAQFQPFDIIGVMRERTPLPRSVLAHLPQLQMVMTAGKQNASIDTAAASELGIVVCGTHSPGHATAELAFLLVMAQARQLITNVNGLRNGVWQAAMGADCRGKTLGVLGLGRLGRQVAALGNAIGMRVIAWSQHLEPAACEAVSVEWVERDTLFQRADFVSIHLRLSDRTRGLVNARDLSNLGPSGYLVNTSRAEIVNPTDLLHALNSGALGGVATDVYTTEPASAGTEPLLQHPKALCTPHIGYVTAETYRVFYGEMVTGINAFIAGQPVNVINP